mgnify:FL=1|tara:strand:+ start:5901 stop:7166 length:1266 start_codon:yes stop_codon:yes gene_type:complete
MIVGIIGSGGREHAICETLKRSKKIEELYCFPGNAGTARIAKNIDIDLKDFEEIKNFILKNKIELVIVGPEKPLVDGIVDYLERFKIKVFGPNKIASKLEGSKIFTKEICKKYDIPTANFGIFKSRETSKNFLKSATYPIVIKADNLASGKGVYICDDKDQGNSAVDEIFNGKFGKAENLLIEEFLIGEEMSFFILTDGISLKNFGTAQDHKRVLEGDKGKNTGGMGAYSPSRLINEEIEKKIINKIIKPTIKAINDLGTKYKGFLYAGLMVTNNEPYLIEYNVRFGDPECQTILPRLNTDLLEIFLASCENRLDQIEIEWSDKKSLCIVLCSKGYPDDFRKDVEIKNIEKINLNKQNFIFHAGTYSNGKKIFSKGGRVLNFVSLRDNFSDARKENIKNLLNLDWSEGYYRRDIGFKVIEK